MKSSSLIEIGLTNYLTPILQLFHKYLTPINFFFKIMTILFITAFGHDFPLKFTAFLPPPVPSAMDSSRAQVGNSANSAGGPADLVTG